jgi:hypothetical protein
MCAVLASVLIVMNRPFYCQAGPNVWTWSSTSSCTSQHLGDPYSFTHVEHGLLFCAMLAFAASRFDTRVRYLVAMALESAWEIAENTPWVIERYRAQTAALGYSGDSLINSLGDLLCACAGFALASWLPKKWSALLAIAIELILLAAIRDNLTLNVLMLVFPLPNIEAWQLGK